MRFTLCQDNAQDLPALLDLMGEEGIDKFYPVSYTHLRAHETVLDLVCRLLLEKKKTQQTNAIYRPKIRMEKQ